MYDASLTNQGTIFGYAEVDDDVPVAKHRIKYIICIYDYNIHIYYFLE